MLTEYRYTAALAALEVLLNRYLRLNPAALDACAELQGRIIEIELNDLNMRIFCHPGPAGLRLAQQVPPKPVDAKIAAPTLALLELALSPEKTSTAIREQIQFSGQIGIAQDLQGLLIGRTMDWEEIIAQQTGDMLAIPLVDAARSLRQWLSSTRHSLGMSLGEYLREEVSMSPAGPEFERFRDAVEDTRQAVARAEARLQRLQARRAPRYG